MVLEVGPIVGDWIIRSHKRIESMVHDISAHKKKPGIVFPKPLEAARSRLSVCKVNEHSPEGCVLILTTSSQDSQK